MWKGNSPKFACTPVLCDSISYVEDHKPIDVYIRNIIPLRIRLLRRQSWPYRGGAMVNFAFTEFSEIHGGIPHRMMRLPPCSAGTKFFVSIKRRQARKGTRLPRRYEAWPTTSSNRS